MFREFSNISLHKLFSWIQIVKVLGVTHANWLRPGRYTRDITKYFFSSKVINRWNRLDQRTVDASSINAFKSRLCYIRDYRTVLFQLWFFSYSCSYSYDFSVSVQVSVIILFQLLFQLFHFSVTVTVTVILNRYKFYEHTRNSVPLQVYNGSYHQYVFEISTCNSTKLHVTSFIVQCQSVTGTHCNHYSLHTSDTVTRSTCGCILEMHAFPDP